MGLILASEAYSFSFFPLVVPLVFINHLCLLHKTERHHLKRHISFWEEWHSFKSSDKRVHKSQTMCDRSNANVIQGTICLPTEVISCIVLHVCKNMYVRKNPLRSSILTWAAPDAGGPEVVLSQWVGYQLVQVGVVAHEARAGVLAHSVVLEVPTGLQHKQQSPSSEGP